MRHDRYRSGQFSTSRKPIVGLVMGNALKRAFYHAISIGVGGEAGIRTLDALTSMPHFECGAFDHSATSPRMGPRRPFRARMPLSHRSCEVRDPRTLLGKIRLHQGIVKVRADRNEAVIAKERKGRSPGKRRTRRLGQL